MSLLFARSMFFRGYWKHILTLFISGPQIETIMGAVSGLGVSVIVLKISNYNFIRGLLRLII